MARLKQRGSEVGLREYLFEDAIAFRAMFADDFVGELSKPIDQLVGREAYTFHRYMLPEDHPARMDGDLSDLMVLTDDDCLTTRSAEGGLQ